jgi:hypothetical protein
MNLQTFFDETEEVGKTHKYVEIKKIFIDIYGNTFGRAVMWRHRKV